MYFFTTSSIFSWGITCSLIPSILIYGSATLEEQKLRRSISRFTNSCTTYFWSCELLKYTLNYFWMCMTPLRNSLKSLLRSVMGCVSTRNKRSISLARSSLYLMQFLPFNVRPCRSWVWILACTSLPFRFRTLLKRPVILAIDIIMSNRIWRARTRSKKLRANKNTVLCKAMWVATCLRTKRPRRCLSNRSWTNALTSAIYARMTFLFSSSTRLSWSMISLRWSAWWIRRFERPCCSARW